MAKAYADIAPTNSEATADYKTTVSLDGVTGRDELTAALQTAMGERRSEEMARGISLVGPHRDDVALSLGPMPAKGYASHGESWSLALALRLASFQLLRADGVEPVLVLDDVFAELDTVRRERLAQAVAASEQVLVTAAVDDDVPGELHGSRFRVAGGTVVPDE